MLKKRFFEYFHNLPRSLQEIFEFIRKPYQKDEEKLKNRNAELLRQSLYLNRLRIESEQRLEELMELVEESNQRADKEHEARLASEEDLKQTKTAWSQQYYLVQRLKTELTTRIFQIQRRIYDCRTPRIWADLSGTIQITNLPRRYGLIGQNINEYFINHQFPNVETRSYDKVVGIIIGKRAYKVESTSKSCEGELQIGTMVRLKRIKGKDLRETKEGLVERIQRRVEQLYTERYKSKPQGT